MGQLYRITLFGFLLTGWLTNGFGQTTTDKFISGDFSNLHFEQFVRQVEAQTPYRFFYNPADVDSLAVDLHVEKQPLRTILQQLFAGSKYTFAVDGQQRVYVTVNRPIRTELPIRFFVRGATDSDLDSTSAAYLTESQKKRSEPELKLYEIGKGANRTAGSSIRPGRSTVGGHVRNAASGEPIVGAAVYIENPRLGTISPRRAKRIGCTSERLQALTITPTMYR